MSDERLAQLAEMRRDYRMRELGDADVHADAIVQVRTWIAEAEAAGALEPNAMTLATVNARGEPSARIVLLKGLDARGFVFYTNYASRKGRELDEVPRAALVLHWKELERQVRVEGDVTKTSDAESDAYFHSRPRGSQLGAVASPQSSVIPSREALHAMAREVEQRYEQAADADVPRPAHWGGYRVVPRRIELWQGRPSRLHDRIVYTRADVGAAWTRARLAP